MFKEEAEEEKTRHRGVPPFWAEARYGDGGQDGPPDHGAAAAGGRRLSRHHEPFGRSCTMQEGRTQSGGIGFGGFDPDDINILWSKDFE